MRELKREINRHITGNATLWIDIDNTVHVRIDDRYFTTEVEIDQLTVQQYNASPYLLTPYVLAKYETMLLKKFIKIA